LSGNKLFLGIIMILMAAGCGLKANPSPVVAADEPEYKKIKISAVYQVDGVVLSWPAVKRKYNRTIIEKSELGTAGNICKNCPRTFGKIADMPAGDENRYVDRLVEKEKSYAYRLKICEESGYCWQSQITEIDVK
jgi:hypothetical protein